MTDRPLEDVTLETLVEELRALRDRNERLEERVADLERRVDECEADADERDDRLAEHETRLETHDDELDAHQSRLETHDDRLDTHDDELETHTERLEHQATETDRIEAVAEATRKRTGANKARIEELQSRELEKGAHLHTENVDEHEVDVPDDRLERITKTDDRTYYRLPDHEDPLNRTDDVALAHGDLLPIQQLARMDADMRRSAANSLPTRLAATLWQARTDPAVGDDPRTDGCKSVDEYVTASDLKHWIRRQEDGISETYAKKLVSRTIDAALERSLHAPARVRTIPGAEPQHVVASRRGGADSCVARSQARSHGHLPPLAGPFASVSWRRDGAAAFADHACWLEATPEPSERDVASPAATSADTGLVPATRAREWTLPDAGAGASRPCETRGVCEEATGHEPGRSPPRNLAITSSYISTGSQLVDACLPRHGGPMRLASASLPHAALTERGSHLGG